MKRTRLDRRTKVAGVIAAALLLSCCLLAGCGAQTEIDDYGDVCFSL